MKLTEEQITALTVLGERALPTDALVQRLGPASKGLIALHREGLVESRMTKRGIPLFMITEKGRNRLNAARDPNTKPLVVAPTPAPTETPPILRKPKSAVELRRFSNLDLDEEADPSDTATRRKK